MALPVSFTRQFLALFFVLCACVLLRLSTPGYSPPDFGAMFLARSGLWPGQSWQLGLPAFCRSGACSRTGFLSCSFDATSTFRAHMQGSPVGNALRLLWGDRMLGNLRWSPSRFFLGIHSEGCALWVLLHVNVSISFMQECVSI